LCIDFLSATIIFCSETIFIFSLIYGNKFTKSEIFNYIIFALQITQTLLTYYALYDILKIQAKLLTLRVISYVIKKKRGETMNKIESFKVDHTCLEPGIYVSRKDGDIVTYDLRMRKPNTGDLMSNSAMHSLEHMLATYLRNGKISEHIIYVGPMGCQTGFYVLVRMDDNVLFLSSLKEALESIVNHEGEMFGKSEIECGNYRNLDVEEARTEAKKYLDILNSRKNTFEY